MLSVNADSIFCIMTSVNKMKHNESEVIIMNKVFSWIRNHKEAAEDAAGLTAFAAVTVAFFFGSGALLVVCGIAGILAIGANVTA